LNKNYAVARGKALNAVHLMAVSSQKIYDWMEEEKKKGGQVKIPKVMKEEKMKDLLSYITRSR
jgi:hypothetical protein